MGRKKSAETPAAAEPVGDLAHDPSTNMPPLESWGSALEDLELEAKNWCDGDPIGSQEQADELTRLIAIIEDRMKQANADREAETKPLHQAWKNKIAEWKPIEERFEKLTRICKRVLTPWLQAVAAENARRAEEARRAAAEAENLAREQAAAARQTGGGFADEEIVEELVEDAKKLDREAKEAERAKPVARGAGRTIGLRKIWLVNVTDRRELLNYYLRNRPDIKEALGKWLHEQAQKDVRGGARHLPGCSIWSEDKAA